MDATDIRSCYDVNKSQGQRTTLLILNGRPPSSNDIAASPGLACLIVVLRRIYAHLLGHPGATTFLNWVKSSEQENPILRVAWHPFGDYPEEIERATMSMNNLAKELASKGFSPDESFYTLCESSLMKRTFWAHQGVRVVSPPAQANMDSQDAAGTYLQATLLEFHPAQKPGQTLQSFADEFFEATTARPPIIRTLYHSDPSQPIDFNSLRSFVPPVHGNSSIDGREKKYLLLAVVRLNDTNHKNDYVRTYSIYGPNMIAEYEPPSFMAHRWSVREGPAKYMLIHGLHEQRTNGQTDFASFPEIVPYHVSQEDASFLRTIDDSLKRAARASEAKSKTTDTKLAGVSQQPEYKDPRIIVGGLYRPKLAWNVKKNSPGYGSDRLFRE
ncbi:hypothetical protein FVEG_06607 [Fusarium verticillioides 7600]|uniref:Uncharacterized protein n=1 Tax=Gibberella moniliformis (strain M3125 / FGSC 7600) TaxID=334819 RepID=W7MEF8_GIBM7|nr:hypothetical protein FVEG_06607 [Fusarium verticillioides 7600]EWG45980.1 hypothetical protein FVEG_06607 [Fusarium verticillioides 7600]